MDYRTFNLPCDFLGSVKLTILYSEADSAHCSTGTTPPRQYFRMEAGPFRVNGKSYDSVDYSFHIQDWTGSGGTVQWHYDSFRATAAGQWDAYMTANASSKVRKALDAAFDDFKGTLQFKDALKTAEQIQRVNLAESIDSRIQDLLTKINKYEKLREMALNHDLSISETDRLKQRLDQDRY